MNKQKKGFTLIELLVVIAIIGILATTLAPKLFLNLRKGTMATVQHNLGVIRTRLSLESISNEFPDLVNGDATLLSAYTIEETPIFTDSNDVTHEATNRVVDQRDDKGGWVYYRDSGKIYANLPDGAYTKHPELEIWTPVLPGLTDYTGSSDLSMEVGESKQISLPTNPVPPTAEFPGPVYTYKNSDDSSIATLSDSGLVTGLTQGSLVVIQTVSPLVAEITVSVTNPPVSFIDDVNNVTEAKDSIVNQTISGNVTTNDFAQVGATNFTVAGYSQVGTYGTLTINDNGAYSYELDNSNTTVDALADAGSLEESFNIDVTENNSGETKTTALTITIKGVNDAPKINLVDTSLVDNHSLEFNGTNDKIEFDEGLIDPNNFTMSLTVNPANVDNGDWQGFIGFQGPVRRSPSMWVNPDHGGLHFDAYDSVDFTRFNFEINDIFVNGVAVNITVVKDANEFRLYIDGNTEPALVRSAPDQVHLEGNFNLGGVDNYFDGTLDNVQVYDVALTPQEINSVYNGEITQPGNLVFHLDKEGSTPLANKGNSDTSFTIVGDPSIVIEGERNVIGINQDEVSIIGTATDVDGTVELVQSSASNGTVTMDANGNIIFTPTPGYTGTDIVSVFIKDNNNVTVSTTFNLQIKEVL